MKRGMLWVSALAALGSCEPPASQGATALPAAPEAAYVHQNLFEWIWRDRPDVLFLSSARAVDGESTPAPVAADYERLGFFRSASEELRDADTPGVFEDLLAAYGLALHRSPASPSTAFVTPALLEPIERHYLSRACALTTAELARVPSRRAVVTVAIPLERVDPVCDGWRLNEFARGARAVPDGLASRSGVVLFGDAVEVRLLACAVLALDGRMDAARALAATDDAQRGAWDLPACDGSRATSGALPWLAQLARTPDLRVLVDAGPYRRLEQGGGGLLRPLHLEEPAAVVELLAFLADEEPQVLGTAGRSVLLRAWSRDEPAPFGIARLVTPDELGALSWSEHQRVLLVESREEPGASPFGGAYGFGETEGWFAGFDHLRSLRTADAELRTSVMTGSLGEVRRAYELNAAFLGAPRVTPAFDLDVREPEREVVLSGDPTLAELLGAVEEACDYGFLVHPAAHEVVFEERLPDVAGARLGAADALRLAEERLLERDLVLVVLRRSAPRMVGIARVESAAWLQPETLRLEELDAYVRHPALWADSLARVPLPERHYWSDKLAHGERVSEHFVVERMTLRGGLVLRGTVRDLLAARDTWRLYEVHRGQYR